MGNVADELGQESNDPAVSSPVENLGEFPVQRLQIPAQTHRCHFIEARMRVHRYPDARLAVFHGPRKLAKHESVGSLMADVPPRNTSTATSERCDSMRSLWNCGRVPMGTGAWGTLSWWGRFPRTCVSSSALELRETGIVWGMVSQVISGFPLGQ